MSNSNSGEGFGAVFLLIGVVAVLWLAIHVVGIVAGWDQSPPPQNQAYHGTSNRGVFD